MEILQAILHYNGYLRVWFDRDISFTVGEGLSAGLASLTCLIMSRSNERMKENCPITGKQSVILTLVEHGIDSIGRDTALAPINVRLVSDKLLKKND